MDYKLSPEQVAERLKVKLSHEFGVCPEDASDEFFYKASVMVLCDFMVAARSEFISKAAAKQTKQVNYLCMEFLLGRSFKNTLYNLNHEKAFEQALSGFQVKLEKLYEQEPDAGLGNGGLGRLAACFMDALATGGYPAMGYSIKYEFGIFKQKLVDGWQTEMPDFWLPGGDVWFDAHPDEAVTVNFDGQVNEWWDGAFHHIEQTNTSPVLAVPYDMMIAGKDGKGISLLRLWKASAPGFDMKLFNQGDYLKAVEQNAMAEVISKVLYPADDHPEGKSLRLRQQYFLVSASVQDIVKRHLSRFGTLDNLPDMVAIHINDTHPALAIPELMRLMLDECGYSWEDAWSIVTRTVAYTNHTVMREALECWHEDLFCHRLPRIYQIVKEIDRRFKQSVIDQTGNHDMAARTAIIDGGLIKMANLSVAASHSVNGVSKLHSEILKKSVFSDFYAISPYKFKNVTNGIAHRRWLCQANPALSGFITELIGDGFVKNASELEKLRAFENDGTVLDKIAEIKRSNKERLIRYMQKEGCGSINPDSIFDVQVKRLHEYKRQHLNALHILSEYLYIKNNPTAPFMPKTYIFGAKAAPGYVVAKQIIQLINKIAQLIDSDPDVRGKLKVIYLEDYRVTLAELMMPAAEISEQISLAGTEASGTGNMKLMLSGAITLGTEDGANVEIHEAVGDDNIIIFGLRTDEVTRRRDSGYNPREYYQNNEQLHEVIDRLNSGIADINFSNIANSLITSDYYMVLADFADYCAAQQKASALYNDKRAWNHMSLINIASAGRFAADRSIAEYAKNIWHMDSCFDTGEADKK